MLARAIKNMYVDGVIIKLALELLFCELEHSAGALEVRLGFDSNVVTIIFLESIKFQSYEILAEVPGIPSIHKYRQNKLMKIR